MFSALKTIITSILINIIIASTVLIILATFFTSTALTLKSSSVIYKYNIRCIRYNRLSTILIILELNNNNIEIEVIIKVKY
jgi:hypothetical protein